jgi:hypothetical protein
MRVKADGLPAHAWCYVFALLPLVEAEAEAHVLLPAHAVQHDLEVIDVGGGRVEGEAGGGLQESEWPRTAHVLVVGHEVVVGELDGFVAGGGEAQAAERGAEGAVGLLLVHEGLGGDALHDGLVLVRPAHADVEHPPAVHQLQVRLPAVGQGVAVLGLHDLVLLERVACLYIEGEESE